jgi:hypothetical protein
MTFHLETGIRRVSNFGRTSFEKDWPGIAEEISVASG